MTTPDAALFDQVAEMARNAARTGEPITACPYEVVDTPRETALARVWVAAFLAARPPMLSQVDYDDPASAE